MPTLRDVRALLAGAGIDLRTAVAAGAGAQTPIAIAGIKARDALIAVYELQPPTATTGGAIVAEHSAQTTVGDGQITISVATTGNQVQVWWWSLP